MDENALWSREGTGMGMSCTLQQRGTMDGNELLNRWNGDENEL
jgi:hypothetical protein